MTVVYSSKSAGAGRTATVGPRMSSRGFPSFQFASRSKLSLATKPASTVTDLRNGDEGLNMEKALELSTRVKLMTKLWCGANPREIGLRTEKPPPRSELTAYENPAAFTASYHFKKD